MNINYYTNNSGKNLILDYINSLSKEEQIDALSVIQCMEEEKFESILFKKWDKKVYEVYFYKHNRIFYITVDKDNIYLLHACKKQKNKTEKKDKNIVIKRAKELDFFAVMRFFMLDSMVYENVRKQIENVKPDMIEIIPGAMPKVISRLCEFIEGKVPVIAGGMIMDKEDTMKALDAGATAISTTRQNVWFM